MSGYVITWPDDSPTHSGFFALTRSWPPACPFCGYIDDGNHPHFHGYNGSRGRGFVCPILAIARHLGITEPRTR
jgi:hypothetical protein